MIILNNSFLLNPPADGGVIPPETDNFRLEVDTTLAGTSGANQFTLPLIPGGTYNFIAVVDGVDQPAHTTDVSPTYTFALSGINTLSIKPANALLPTEGFAGVYFNDAGDKLKVLDVSSWGEMLWEDFRASFFGCANMVITSTDVVPVSAGATTTENMFNGCTSLSALPAVFDTTNITNANGMLSGCYMLDSLPAYPWDSCASFDGFLTNVEINSADYNNFLIELDANGLSTGTLNGGWSVPTGAGITARDSLIAKSWAIEDDEGRLVRYRLDGNDPSLVPIMSPPFVPGLDLPDKLAANFNGVDQYFTANADSATIATIADGPFTISFRIKISIAAARTILQFGDHDTPGGFKVNVRAVGGLTFNVDSDNLNLFDARFLDGIWLHVVITGTGSTGDLEYFVDGVSEQTRALPAYSFIDDNLVEIAETGLPCDLDDFRIYNNVARQSKITALLNNT